MTKVGRPVGTPKTGGRVKGTQNKRTEKIKKALSELVCGNLDRLNEEISRLDGKDYVWAMEKIVGYVVPKPTEVKVEGDIKSETTITKSDQELLDSLPQDVINSIALQLQESMRDIQSEDSDESDIEEEAE